MVACQFSLYPLREQKLGPILNEAVMELRAVGLRPDVGTMSTYVEGADATVFDGLRRAFEAAAGRGDVVLVATVSNACPVDPRKGT
jgi:uncharacterized protein YqgV (UPF0045/DUF77 family)